VHHQPQSALSQWFLKRFGKGARLRKIGIVALARKLLVALWKYLERGEVPRDAMVVEWQSKFGGQAA
jgi:transposase